MISIFEDIDKGYYYGKSEPKAKIPKQGIGLNFDAMERASYEKEKTRLIKRETSKSGKKIAHDELFGESIKKQKKAERVKAFKEGVVKKTVGFFKQDTKLPFSFRGRGPLRENISNPFTKTMGNPYGKGKNILMPR